MNLLKFRLFFITTDAKQKYLSDESATLDIKLKVDIGIRKEQRRMSLDISIIEHPLPSFLELITIIWVMGKMAIHYSGK